MTDESGTSTPLGIHLHISFPAAVIYAAKHVFESIARNHDPL